MTTLPLALLAVLNPVSLHLYQQIPLPPQQELVVELYRNFDAPLVPIMHQIAICESSVRQFENGKPLLSVTNDWGILQINGVHEKEAAKLGLDFKNSLADNVRMAKVVYEERVRRGQDGLSPWSCAAKLGLLKE